MTRQHAARTPELDGDRDSLGERRSLGVLSQAVEAALFYSYPSRSLTTSSDPAAIVTRYMEDHFFDEILVDRPEMTSLQTRLGVGSVVALTGERGSGKSTVLAVLQRNLATDGTLGLDELTRPQYSRHVEMVDLAIHSASIRAKTTTLCDIAYQQLFGSTILPRPTLQDRYWAYLAQVTSAFDTFRSEALRLGLIETDDDWIRASHRGDLSILWQAGLERERTRDGRERLSSLLDFLSERCNHETVLVIDNSDHLSNDFQVDLTVTLFELSESTTRRLSPVVAVRTENYRQIRRSLKDRGRVTHEALSQQPLGEPDFDLVQDFLRRRFTIIRNLMPKLEPLFQAGLVGDAAFGFANVSALFEAVHKLLELFTSSIFTRQPRDLPAGATPAYDLDNKRFLGYMRRWYNGSLRYMAWGMFDFLDEILSNNDPAYPFKELLADVRLVDDSVTRQRINNERRLVRTILFRNLMFCGREAGQEADPSATYAAGPPSQILILAPRRESSNAPFLFGSLQALQFLNHVRRSQAVGHRPTVLDARGMYRDFGVDEEAADRIIRRLADPRHEEDTGLIRLDCNPEELQQGLDASMTVELMPAGLFLAEHLCFTCEFLFWSAWYIPHAWSKLGISQWRVSPRDLRRDNFRVLVASRFVERVLMPAFAEEHGKLDDSDAAVERLGLYESYFGFARSDWFLDRCRDSLINFVGEEKFRRSTYSAARTSLDAVNAFCRRLDRLVAQR